MGRQYFHAPHHLELFGDMKPREGYEIKNAIFGGSPQHTYKDWSEEKRATVQKYLTYINPHDVVNRAHVNTIENSNLVCYIKRDGFTVPMILMKWDKDKLWALEGHHRSTAAIYCNVLSVPSVVLTLIHQGG